MTEESRNRIAGEQVVRNIIHCFKWSQSSEDFMALSDLNYLTPGFDAAVKTILPHRSLLLGTSYSLF